MRVSLLGEVERKGGYDEAEKIKVEVLALRRDIIGEKQPDTIWETGLGDRRGGHQPFVNTVRVLFGQ